MLLTHKCIRNNTEFPGMNFAFYNHGYVLPLGEKGVLATWFDFCAEVESIAPKWETFWSSEKVKLPQKQYFIPIGGFAVYANVEPKELESLKIGDSCKIKEYTITKVSDSLIIAEY